MTMVTPPEIPSAWAAYGPILAGIVRAMLAAVGAAGFTWAQSVTGSQVEMAVGAAMMFAAAMWSIWQKIGAAREARRLAANAAVVSAELSAERGVPTPVIPPSPPGTTAVDLNNAELERIRQGGRV
jgi:hypothetical protein